MRNIFILVVLSLFLSLFGHSQTKSHWGKIIKDATDTRVSNLDVDLYEYNGDSLYQLVENDTIPGYYYLDSVAVGMYDLYIDGVKKLPGIWIGANILSKAAAYLDNAGRLSGSGIIDGTIAAVDIATGAVTTTELLNGSAKLEDFKSVLLEDQTASIDSSEVHVNISAYSFTNPKVIVTNKSDWHCYFKSTTSTVVVLGIDPFGADSVVTYDLLIIEE